MSCRQPRPIKAGERYSDKRCGQSRGHNGFNDRWDGMLLAEQMANCATLRTVWWIPPAQFKETHSANFAEDLILPCILVGCPTGGTVLDQFGSGTTSLVARRLNGNAIGIELNEFYSQIALRRLSQKVLALA
jgi:DNA modification methylase